MTKSISDSLNTVSLPNSDPVEYVGDTVNQKVTRSTPKSI